MHDALFVAAAALCSPEPDRVEAFGLKCYAVDKLLLPTVLRRRTSLTTRMAVTAAVHACRLAEVDPSRLPSVFASVGGEIQITDALCRTLPDIEALVSPTQFHNSVHNTTAGYWSIINQCQFATSAIAAVDDTLAMGLLEAWSQLQQTQGDMLLVCYDENWPQYLAPPMGQTAMACALVLSTQGGREQHKIALPRTSRRNLTIKQELLQFMQATPAAAVIPLLQALQSQSDKLIPLNYSGLRWYTQLV